MFLHFTLKISSRLLFSNSILSVPKCSILTILSLYLSLSLSLSLSHTHTHTHTYTHSLPFYLFLALSLFLSRSFFPSPHLSQALYLSRSFHVTLWLSLSLSPSLTLSIFKDISLPPITLQPHAPSLFFSQSRTLASLNDIFSTCGAESRSPLILNIRVETAAS